MSKKLVDRYKSGEVPRKGVWFRYGEHSILNVGKLMESSPFSWHDFNGWEAMTKEGEIIREQTWEKLKEKL